MSNPRPIQVAKEQGKDLEDEYLFYDRDGERVHVLNATAREIYLLCDGTRTEQEVAAEFGKKYELDEDTAEKDTSQIIGELVDLGVIRRD
jgi:hypothetical protein